MNEIVLLGAGASVEAGVPAAYEMTNSILGKLDETWPSQPYGRVARFVIGGLLFQAGIRGEEPLHCGVNVEDFFNAVLLLADRSHLEAAPFIGSWHSMVDEFDTVGPSYVNLDHLSHEIFRSVRDRLLDAFSTTPPSGADKINRALEKAISSTFEAAVKKQHTSLSGSASPGHAVEAYLKEVVTRWESKLKGTHATSSSRLEREFRRAVDQSQVQPGQGRVFREVAEFMIRSLVEIAWIGSPECVTYLRPLLASARAGRRMVIATLNYDNAIELAAESAGIACHTGLEDWSELRRFDLSGGGLHLLKLHGSIDWMLRRDEVSEERPLPHSTIAQASPEELREPNLMPAVIFGQRNKLTAEGPFLDLLRAFEQELRQADVLTVCGYSFRDEHINTYLVEWLNRTEANHLRVISPRFDSSQVEFVTRLQTLRERRPGQLEVIAQTAREGLLTVYGDADGPGVDSATSDSEPEAVE